MRILLATEGPTDEIVASAIIRRVLPDAIIDLKKFAARGIPVVKRGAPGFARAAHFGHHDALVIHFDLDGHAHGTEGLPSGVARHVAIDDAVCRTLDSLPDAGRASRVRVVYMTPIESTDAWLQWALENGDGTEWEQKNRHYLKRLVFGDPPRGFIRKTQEIIPELLMRMSASDAWPNQLTAFEEALRGIERK